MAHTSAVFVGNARLLIQCADAYREAGHQIHAIASHNRNILEWAASQGIAAIGMDGDWHGALRALRFDYLFSVANLHILPADLLTRAGKLAINFHDGPLPRYAGLNATSWALIAQEQTHGVTWHEMTPIVDAGRIVRQALFPIAPQETALSLNARCHEEGLAAFKAIVQDIGQGELALRAQGGGFEYFGRERRPDALATIDFSRPAKEIAALVRGLDFGPSPNPLARPKIHFGDRIVLVREAQTLTQSSPDPPGTVLSVLDDSLRIRAVQGDVMFSGLTDGAGHAAVHGLAPGMVVAALTAQVRDRLAARTPRIAKGEAFWSHALASLAPVELPYPRTLSWPPAPTKAPEPMQVDVAASVHGAQAVAAFFAWMSALTGQERISVRYSDGTLAEHAGGLESWLSPWVALTLTTTPQTRPLDAAAAAEMQIANIHNAGPYPHDLPSRLGQQQATTLGLCKIGICLGGGAVVPGGIELLLATDPNSGGLKLACDEAVMSRETLQAMARHLGAWLDGFANAGAAMADIALLPQEEAQAIAAMNTTTAACDSAACIHDAIAAQVARTPQHEAICCQGRSLSYRALDQEATSLALRLAQRGVQPGDIVGLCLPRTPELVVGLLAILKAGAAYLPLDPAYPAERIAFMIEDSATQLIVTTCAIAAALRLPQDRTLAIDLPQPDLAAATGRLPEVAAQSPAYLIYTSGSTGQPKGVVVTHGNVMNLFAGMRSRIPHDPPGRWLAVTSLSFDISVLELCWTLAHGFTVVLYSQALQDPPAAPDFSLFYFASDSQAQPEDRYRLLLEGAKFADSQGFAAIWTPERHFHAFGGLYPNPALTSAAIAAITTRLKIRAGSCVLPLHHPIRVAEDWAFVDNISQGRIGVSFASGWQPNDFVLAPQAFANRKSDMFAHIDVVRRLWRGESVAFPGPLGQSVDIRTLPRPIQPQLPIWLTGAGNPETFRQAGQMGCYLLTHLLGQSVDEVGEKLKVYRQAWRQAGHAGSGHVTLMLHTFVGQDEDQVRQTVRGPMKEYLRSSVDLIRQAAWTFPALVERGAQRGKSPAEIMDAEPLSEQDMDALLEHAFTRYYGSSALFGTPSRCLAMVARLQEIGVDEIACLIDFGVAGNTVLAHLHDLKQLMDASRQPRPGLQQACLAQEIVRGQATHLQCTPSMASMLVADAAGRAALARLSVLLVGGEALPLELARQLQALVAGKVLNMYGPTETTVWSSTGDVADMQDFVALGQPIANTRLHIRTPWGQECPALVPGELLIGGAGVAQGYWRRPQLDAERFVADGDQPGARAYRTGDMVRRHAAGAIEFLGRVDHQVKIRGHRVELAEIESLLMRQPGVQQAVVIARAGAAGDQRLIAYVTPKAEAAPDPDQMRRALARQLPEVMLPQSVLVLQSFPSTPNGKLDRAALPQPQLQSTPVLAAAAAPQGQLETAIAAIWQDVLGRPQVGRSDNFFDLGGHSLLVVQVQRRLREAHGHEISITDMFRLPTVRALAAHLSGTAVSSAVRDAAERANVRRSMRSRVGAQPAAPSA